MMVIVCSGKKVKHKQREKVFLENQFIECDPRFNIFLFMPNPMAILK